MHCVCARRCISICTSSWRSLVEVGGQVARLRSSSDTSGENNFHHVQEAGQSRQWHRCREEQSRWYHIVASNDNDTIRGIYKIAHCSIKNIKKFCALQFDADIIRFSINRNEPMSYEDFEKLLAERHDLGTDLNFLIWYTDTDGDLLPINNNNNLARALLATRCLLRIFIQRKGNIM